MKIAWITDPHLNFLSKEQIKNLCMQICSTKADAIFITGDISEAPDFVIHTRMLEFFCRMPIYFVCGNHDYYRGSIKEMRKELSRQFGKNGPTNNKSFWMNEHGVKTLAPGVAVVGTDGWYDGQYASFMNSKLLMNDYSLIEELRYDTYNTFQKDHYKTCLELSREGAEHARKYLKKAFDNHDVVYFLTHVPPFKENSRAPNGKMSDINWLPYFSSKFIGDAILETMYSIPSAAELIVLCGHTHTYWKHKPLPNVTCITGGADYGKPNICGVFEI